MAKRLKSLDMPFTRIIQSSMTRAKNTASVISKHLNDVPVETCDFLREGAPIRPVPPTSSHWRPDAHVSVRKVQCTFIGKENIFCLYSVFNQTGSSV